jgi:hypothetical protein
VQVVKELSVEKGVSRSDHWSEEQRRH